MVKADLDKETRLAMQRVAREEMKHRIYADILADMMVCDIEGWDKMEYINELKTMLNTLGNIHKPKKTNKMTEDLFDFEERKDEYAQHLQTITNGLMDMARAAGRKHFTKNQLLRECYNLVNDELHTEEEWNERGAYVKHGEHAYLFWKGEEVEFRFARFQVKFERESERIDREYDKIHEEYPDAICLFRCGDFYEVYRDDAQNVCKVLNITLTHRHYSDGSRIEMAGFPFHALDTYLPKLVRAGLRVAICDEISKK